MGQQAVTVVADVDPPELLAPTLVERLGLDQHAVPAVTERRKCVVLVSPTATIPRSRTAVLAPMLAADSMAVA